MKSTLCLSLAAVLIIVLGLVCSVPLLAEDQVAQQPTTTSVPNLIRYGGVLKDANGAPLASQTVGVTFSIYKEAEGGVSLWHETRNVTTDPSGQYNVLLGSSMTEGVPVDLFKDQEQRWLSVQVQDQAETARALLVSVPYAFKAHDAETLGGLPASAFVKAPTADATAGVMSAGTSPSGALSAAGTSGIASKGKTTSGNVPPAICTPVPGAITFWDQDGSLCPSNFFQNLTTGNIGIGLLNPSEPLDVKGVISTYQWYDINENRIVSVHNSIGSSAPNNSTNLFLGWNAGDVNVGDTNGNTFTGRAAGTSNTTGANNTFTGWEVGTFHQTGSENSFYGVRTGRNNSSGSSNALYGFQSGYNNNGSNNAFFGRSAGFDSSGSDNTFVGQVSGYNDLGSHNTYIGENSGVGIVSGNNTGSHNTFVGDSSGLNNTGGGGNTYLGDSSGLNASNGIQNTFVGLQAGYGATANTPNSGRDNAFLGYAAGGFTTNGSFNTYMGSRAGVANTTGQQNVFVGYQAGANSTSGQGQIYIGNLGTNTNGEIRIGDPSVNKKLTWIAGIVDNPFPPNTGSPVVIDGTGHLGIAGPGPNNPVTGACGLGANFLTKWTANKIVDCSRVWENPAGTNAYYVGIGPFFQLGTQVSTKQLQVDGDIDILHKDSNTHYQITEQTVLSIDGTNNVFTGVGAGTASGSTKENTFTGYNAGNVNTADGNSFYGFESGAANITGIQNVFSGYKSGVANTTGFSNVFIGYRTGEANITESYSTFVGTVAGAKSIVGGNTFLGYSAGSNTNTGYGNVATGYDAGRSNTTGILNAYFGVNAGFNGNIGQDTTGNYNTYIGNGAGSSSGLVNGSNNIFLGFAAGNAEGNVSNNIEIGNSGPSPLGAQSNTILIGTKAVYNKVFFDPILNNATNLNQVVTIDANGQLGFNTISGGGGGNVVGPTNPNCPTNFLTKWSGGLNVDCSVVFQQPGTNNIGINNTNPSEALDVTGVINTSQWYDILPSQLPVLAVGASSSWNDLYVGIGAGSSNAATDNTFVGSNAGHVNTVARQNTFVGSNAGLSNTGALNTSNGQDNTYLGFNAGQGDDIGYENVFIGSHSGESATGSGHGNTFVGTNAGAAIADSYGNTFIGSGAGNVNATNSSGNIFIGEDSGYLNSGGYFNIYIGNGCTTNCTENQTIRIGVSPNQAAAYMAGIYNRSVGPSPAEVCIGSDGKLGTLGCPGNLPAVQKQQAALESQQNELQGLQSLVAAQQQEIETLKSQLQLQNAAFQERLSRLESALSSQVAVADKATRTPSSPNGGMQ